MGWVSVDDRDNDPAVLLTYIAVALDRHRADRSGCVPGARVVGRRHRGPQAARLGDRRRCGARSRSSSTTSKRSRTASALDAIAALALGLPAGSQLAIGSRDELPLPAARLRAQGGIVEIGVDDLAMGSEEAASLLTAAGVELADADLHELVRRTEGWPVGLYLAALAVKAGGSPADDRSDVHRR